LIVKSFSQRIHEPHDNDTSHKEHHDVIAFGVV
jgi:hypothetical protein